MLRYLTLILISTLMVACEESLEGSETESIVIANTPALSSSVLTDVIYGHKDGLALTFDVYSPAEPNGAGVISILSSGWQSSWELMQQFVETPSGLQPMSNQETNAAGGLLVAHSYASLIEKGFTVFAVRHSSSPRYPMSEIVNDMHRAVRYIRFHASDYNVEAERIGAWGGSAGGHLALLLASTAAPGLANPDEDFESESTRIAAAVAYAPPTDLQRLGTPDFRRSFSALDLNEEQGQLYSPIHFASADDAPSLILHGDQDMLVPIIEGRSMYQALSDAGVEADFITVEGSGHGFNGNDGIQANSAMVDWFEQHLN
jgi:dienelactone hydrolase